MTTMAQLRKAALALPEVEEGTHFGMASFFVRGKGFASVTKDGAVQLHLPDEVAETAVADHPSGERLIRMGTPIGASIPLADVNGKYLNDLVRQAWHARAPKGLAESLRSAQAAARADGVGDLPRSIGKPALGALAGAGVTSLDDVAAWTEAELLALHGVGPKAVRILRETLADKGLSFR